MVLHTCWDPTRLVIMTVGDGSLVFEAIRLRLPVLIIVRNLTVKKYVLRNLQERLTKCVCDPDNERFYRRFGSDSDEIVTEERKEGGEDVVVLAEGKDAGAGADADGQGGAVGNGDEGQEEEDENEIEDGESSSGND